MNHNDNELVKGACEATAGVGTVCLLAFICVFIMMSLTGCKAAGNFLGAVGDGLYSVGESLDARSRDHRPE